MAGSQSQVQPLAQTFKNDTIGGCFLTSLDLFFAFKDPNLPIWVEIRNVVAGAPGQMVLPHSRKVLEPTQVNENLEDGTTPTNFTFDSPVYIQEGNEYAIVVLSKSQDYRIYTAGMGELDLATGAVVSSQPALGVLYKSSNDSAWTPVQNEDLKFKLRRAFFAYNFSGKVTLQNEIIGEAVSYADDSADGIGVAYGKRLKTNPLVLQNGSQELRVKHKDHGMYSTSNKVEIRNASSGFSTTLNGAITASATSLVLNPSVTGGSTVTGFEASNDSSKIYLKIGNEIMKGTLSSLNVSSITRAQDTTTAVAHASGARVELYQINKTPLTEINKVHTSIANIDMDSYTISLTNAPTVSGSSDTTEVGGNEVYASENYRYETIKPVVKALEFPKTNIGLTLGSTSGTSPSGTETSFTKATTDTIIPLGENFEHDTSRIVASNINEANEMSSVKSLETKITLKTDNRNISPVIDLDRASTVLIANRLDNIDSSSDVYPTAEYIPSTEPEGDNNSAIYLTKAVSLENPATALRVFFSANKIDTSEIKVLFKILRTDDTSSLDELGYTFFNDTGSPDVIPPNSLGRDDLQEYSFSAGIKDDGIGDALDEFISFQIKIVMQGTDAANPPRIKDLRAIALAT